MRKTTLLVAALLFSVFTQAQEKQKEPLPDAKLGYSWGNKFHLIDENGLKIQRNLKKPDMYTLLADYPAGMELYDQYRTSKTLSKIFTWTSAGTAVAGLACIIASIDWESGDYNDNLFWTGVGLEGATIALAGGGLAFGIVSKVRGYKLSSGYNKYRERYSLNFGQTRNGIGLILKF